MMTRSCWNEPLPTPHAIHVLLRRKLVGYNIRNGDFLVVFDRLRSRGNALTFAAH
jgi:hypothetical protein